MWLAETPSTNTYLRELAASGAEAAPSGLVVAAVAQTAGRGQRGNHWEASPGLNLTFSMLLRPQTLRPAEQFLISEAVSRALVALLQRHLPLPQAVAVKWPNDIYVGDSKICGILIEHSLAGDHISHTIVGVGLNVNQRRFLSDAPNPVSMRQLLGVDTPLEPLLDELTALIGRYFAAIDTPSPSGEAAREEMHRWFCSHLWRGTGLWPWRLPDGTTFQASIAGILPTGHLQLLPPDSAQPLTFAFKEVAPVLASE